MALKRFSWNLRNRLEQVWWFSMNIYSQNVFYTSIAQVYKVMQTVQKNSKEVRVSGMQSHLGALFLKLPNERIVYFPHSPSTHRFLLAGMMPIAVPCPLLLSCFFFFPRCTYGNLSRLTSDKVALERQKSSDRTNERHLQLLILFSRRSSRVGNHAWALLHE